MIKSRADDKAKNSALQHAAFYASRFDGDGDNPWEPIARALLDAGAYYDIESAIYLFDLDRVRALLKKQPRHAKKPDLLATAAYEGYAPIVKLLLDCGADPNGKSRGGLPMLYDAIDHPAIMRMLLRAGADPRVRLNYRGMGKGPPAGSTLLHLAAERGGFASAKVLVGHGVEIDARDKYDRTPLHMAAWAGNWRVVELLLDRGADPRVRDESGCTPLMVAAGNVWPGAQEKERRARFLEVVTVILGRGVPIDLRSAIDLGKGERVRQLLQAKPSRANRKLFGTLPLHQAVKRDQRAVAVVLLDGGARVNSHDEDGQTALHLAAFWGRTEMARLLIARKADVNTSDKNGFTALHESVELGTTGVARLLLAAGARVNAKDHKGRTPLSYLGERRKPPQELVTLLRKYGAQK